MDFDTLSQRIADAFPELSSQLQRAARHALDHPDDVALLSMRALAAEADVPPSTMVRLAKSLGFESFADFKAPFEARVRIRPETYAVRARDIQARGGADGDGLQDEVLQSNIRNLQETFANNDTEKISGCAKTLARARHVYILGLRSSYPVAFFAHYAFRMFRDNVTILDGHGGTFADVLRSFRHDDTMFVIGFAPYAKETIRAVEYAKHQGGRIVAFTESPVSPLVKLADQVMIIRNDSPAFFSSVSAAMAAVEALVVHMVSRGGDVALGTIEESEEQLERFGAYWMKRTD